MLKADSAEQQSKFGKIRLSNAKINKAIVAVYGATELLLVREKKIIFVCCWFTLYEILEKKEKTKQQKKKW